MNKEIEEMIQNRIEDIYQSGEYIYQAKELEKILSYIEQLEKENDNINDTLAKIKDLNTMQYLNEKNFKYSLNEILKGDSECD